MKIKHYVPMVVMTSLLSFNVFAANTTAPNDNEITKIMDTVNSEEIITAQLALKNSNNAEVKQFAEHMIKDHKMNAKKTGALNVTPLENAKSMAMKQDGEMNLDKLKSLKGKEFDKAYIADQLKTHEGVLKELNTTLIPNAKNKELKQHLEMTAKKVESHIEHAKTIQATL